MALITSSSAVAGGSWLTILNEESLTFRLPAISRADRWIAETMLFLLSSLISRVSDQQRSNFCEM